jgi:serine/threonine-protein kinase RsbW
MTPVNGTTIQLQFSSAFDMLDMVQAVSEHVGRLLHFEDDALQWMEVAIRESVINAIKHGNKHDASKNVFVEFEMTPAAQPAELIVRIRDEGEGFDPESIPDPLAPENLLKASGRGIFFMRSFMDDVQLARAEGGGMQVTLIKKIEPTQ